MAAAEERGESSTNSIPAGHSAHGEAFNEGPRQQAYLIEGMGNVHFPITTTVPEAQEFFDQGIGQLHGFYYFEAERSFRQVAALDTNCAMACWGMAMANINNSKRAEDFIKKAALLKTNASPRELLWIDALHAYYTDKKDNKRRDYVRALEKIVQEYPDDIEAKAFLVFQIWDNGSRGVSISSHQAVDALAAQVLEKNPLHPIHHYRIHLWDNEKPARALDSAARCGPSAPGIAHMWHMPGHIYWKLHRYGDSAWQQEASARVDHAQMVRDRLLPDQIHNYAHNNEWLVRSLSHVGRVQAAIDLAKNMIELPRHPRYNTLIRARSEPESLRYDRRSSSATYGRSRLFELLVRYQLWDELIALSDTVYLEPTDIPEEQIKHLRALGVAHFNKGDNKSGGKQIAALERMLKKQKAARFADAEKAEAAAEEAKDDSEKTAKAMVEAMRAHEQRLKSIREALAELRGFQALARRKRADALAHFQKAKLSKERLAQIHLRLRDEEKARSLAKEAVASGTNQVQLLANYADILWRTGKEEEAKEVFKELRTLSAQLDLGIPLLQRMAPIAGSLDLPEDWRAPAAVASDIGDRPSLDELGPFRWTPPPAPEWALPDSDGKEISLADYRGKPVIAIFYLGYGCVHCVEQLKAFAPVAEKFQEAGISLVAISSDALEALGKTLEKTSKGPAIPFPLVSDQSLETFKAYRAYDDFEQIPLHGTFLIDADGLIRWHDINYEPFTEVDFLLGEAKRLLGLPGQKLVAGVER